MNRGVYTRDLRPSTWLGRCKHRGQKEYAGLIGGGKVLVCSGCKAILVPFENTPLVRPVSR